MKEGGGRNPEVSRRRLRRALRQARFDAELTQDQVAAEMDWSLSKIIRIENGSGSVTKNDLSALLRLYGVTNEDRLSELLELCRVARQKSWWSQFETVVPRELLRLVQYEQEAHLCRSYESRFVPGVFQTEEYAEEVLKRFFAETDGGAGDDVIDRKAAASVQFRLKRQEVLEGVGALRYHSIMDEAVVRRLVGGADVMRSQLQKLVELSRRPNITIDIIPFAAGLYPRLGSPFLLLEFSDAADGDLIYLERMERDEILDDSDKMVGYRQDFNRLHRASLGSGSAAFLERIVDVL